MTGRPGKWPWTHHSVAVTPLIPTIRLAVGVVLDDPVDQQDRPAVRDERLDLAGRVDRAGCRQGVGHRSVRSGLRPRRRGEERRAPDAVEQVGRHAPLEERLVVEQRPVDRDVGHEASTSSSSSAARPRAIAVARSGPQTTSLPSSES